MKEILIMVKEFDTKGKLSGISSYVATGLDYLPATNVLLLSNTNNMYDTTQFKLSNYTMRGDTIDFLTDCFLDGTNACIEMVQKREDDDVFSKSVYCGGVCLECKTSDCKLSGDEKEYIFRILNLYNRKGDSK